MGLLGQQVSTFKAFESKMDRRSPEEQSHAPLSPEFHNSSALREKIIKFWEDRAFLMVDKGLSYLSKGGLGSFMADGRLQQVTITRHLHLSVCLKKL